MKLKQAREESGKSQMTVAFENGLAMSSYRKIETGGTRRPHITNVYGIAASVGMDPHEIDEFVETLAEYETAKAGLSLAQQDSANVEHFYFPARFQAALEREVERRMEVLASQNMNDVQVAAQGGDGVVTQT